MLVTPSGMVSSFKPVHPWKQLEGIVDMFPVRVIVSRFTQDSNAWYPIRYTQSGI